MAILNKPLTPFETWKKNKWRLDLRTYTREFQKKFESKKIVNILPGCVYATKYLIDSTIPTDKYHFTPVIVSFGRFKNDEGVVYTRGLNLMYLRNEQKIEILNEVFNYIEKVPDARVAPLIKIHDKWMKIAPYAFKNLEERRITGITEIDSTEWGMIPLLKEYLFGTFNAVLLNEDFQKENKLPIIKRKKKIEKATPVVTQEEETLTEDILLTENGMVDLDYEDDY